MKLSFVPIDMIASPNSYTQLSEWSVTQGTGERLYLQLQVSDALGTRRYMPATGATLTVTFTRARSSSLGATDTQQTFTVTGTVVSEDRSMWYVTLTSTQVNTLITGTVTAALTEGTTVYTLNKSYAIKKIYTGSGC